MKVHSCVAAALALGAVAAGSRAVQKSDPERTARARVGPAPGGGTDTVRRLLTHKLSEGLGQPFVVGNRPSFGGDFAGKFAARAASDGYTLITVTPMAVVDPSLFRELFDALRAFAPMVRLSATNYMQSVRTALPVASVQDLIALARGRPPKLASASTGTGTRTIGQSNGSGPWPESASCTGPTRGACLRSPHRSQARSR